MTLALVRPAARNDRPIIPGVVTYEFTFVADGDFAATRLAEQFLRERGFSFGPTQGPDPRAVMFGDYLVAKWRNLTRADKAANHGVMLGRPRTGPITVIVYSTAPAAAVAAMKAAPTFFEGAVT